MSATLLAHDLAAAHGGRTLFSGLDLLDLPAIEQLEDALGPFPGTLLLVSHDRRLLKSVQVTRRLAVEAGAVREVPT